MVQLRSLLVGYSICRSALPHLKRFKNHESVFHCLETQCWECGQPRNLRKAESPGPSIPTLLRHRFSAFWLRSKCSICSYQLNIWYEDHVSSSILIWFLPGETRSVACNAGFTSRPCIAVPQGLAHFPVNLYNWVFSITWERLKVQLHPFQHFFGIASRSVISNKSQEVASMFT